MDEPVTSRELREQAPLALVLSAAVQTDSAAPEPSPGSPMQLRGPPGVWPSIKSAEDLVGTYEMSLALRSFGKAIVRQRLGSTGHTQYMHAEVISTVNMSTSNSFSRLSPNRSSHLS